MIRVGRALGVAIWLTAALVLYDIARVPLASIRPEEVSSQVREVAARGLEIYGLGSLALAALGSAVLFLLSARRKGSGREPGGDFPALAGAAIFTGVISFSMAAFGERESGPPWPGAAWFLDFFLMSMGAAAAGWMAARLLRAASRDRARSRIAAMAMAPLLPALILGWPALRAAIGPAAGAPRAEADELLPDVLLIAADSLRADALSCYGGDARTPSLDALAARGVMLADASSTSPSGPPAVASLFTSRLPSDSGVTWQEARLHDGVPTLAGVLRSRGYRTAAFVANPALGVQQGIDRGFERWDAAIDPRPAARIPEMLSSRIAAAVGLRRRHAWPTARQMVDRVLPYLAKASDSPRFTYLHLGDPHDPYAPPADLLAAVNASERSRLSFGPGTLSSILRGEITLTAEDLKRVRALYRAEAEGLDREVGRLISALRARIDSGRTIVIFVSDHGEELMDHGSMGHGHTLFEEILEVPAIFVSSKTLPSGAVMEDPASMIDVAPTILELLGLPAEPRFAGRGLLRALTGAGAPPEPGGPIASQMDSIGYHTTRHWARAARSGNVKVILSATDVLGIGSWKSEIYDLGADPAEKRAIGPGLEEAERLDAWLRAWVRREKRLTPPEPEPARAAVPEEAPADVF